MTPRLLALSAVALAFAACTPATAPGTNGGAVPPAASSSSVDAQRPPSKEGGACGGIAGFQCEPGLFCKYDGAYPDAGGVCIK